MDFNTILVKFGLESSNFTNKLLEVTKNGVIIFIMLRRHIKNQYALIVIINIYSFMGING